MKSPPVVALPVPTAPIARSAFDRPGKVDLDTVRTPGKRSAGTSVAAGGKAMPVAASGRWHDTRVPMAAVRP